MMTKSDLNALAQTLFVPRTDENRQFEKMIIEHYLLNVHIQNKHAHTDVEIVYSNPNESDVDGIFIIPFSKYADTVNFEVRIDGKVIPIKLAKINKLKKIYGNTFQTLDFDISEELGSSYLQSKVLQIPAGGQCSVKIWYDETIKHTDHNYVYTHHLRSNQSIGNFEMKVVIDGNNGFDDINSSTHEVAISNENDNRVYLTYQATDMVLDKDFECSYSLAAPDLIEMELLSFEDPNMVVSEVEEPLLVQKSPNVLYRSQSPSVAVSFQQRVSTRNRGVARLGELQAYQRNLPTNLGLTPPNGAAYRDVFFKGHGTNPFIDTEDDNMSTFGMDADSASYSVTRRFLQDGNLPEPDSVRVEEFINAFDYNYTPPTDAAFAVHLEGAPSKFGKGKRLQLLRIGIQGQVIPDTDRKDANLTFVIDVSGSMGYENRLGHVKKALRLLVDQLRPSDKIGIVVYGTNARVVLPHTSVVNQEHILKNIDTLCTEGVTNLEDGIHKGYELALKNAKQDCINRVILCSDGVANQGVTSPEMLLKEIRDYVEDDIYLTTVGFGMGNFNDVLMEELAKKGNGNYAYVDTIKEAKRIFVENLTGTLQVIAKDAKIQVEFNEKTVSRFRLLGYENRQMKHEDFRNDDADAGEIGSGHSVTALYEIKLHKGVDSGKLGTVFIRHEDPNTAEVTEVNEKLLVEDLKASFEDTTPDFKFAASVAQFAEILRESVWAKEGSLAAVQRTLKGILPHYQSKSSQHGNRQKELFNLVRKARRLKDMSDAQLG